MSRQRSPLTPIFNYEPRRGTINVGNTPGIPTTPTYALTLLDEITGTGMANSDDVCFVGSVAFVTSDTTGTDDELGAFDISDPSDLSEIAVLSDSSLQGAWTCDSDATHVYVGSITTGILTSVDVTNPASMAVADTLPMPNGATEVRCVVVNGTVAYCSTNGDTWGQIVSVDISDPSNMVILDDFTYGLNRGMVVSGDYLYFHEDNGDIVAYDISDPSDMTYAQYTTSAAYAPSFGEIRSLAITGSVLVAACAGGGADGEGAVVTFDLSNMPTSIDQLDRLDAADHPELTHVANAAIIGGHAYLASWDEELLVAVDISNPADISIVETLALPGATTVYSLRSHAGGLYLPVEEASPSLMSIGTTYP